MLPQSVLAAWTGIGAFVGEGDTDWSFNGTVLQASSRNYGFRIEEKTQVDLRVGASAGQLSLTLKDPDNILPTEKFEGQFLSFYLRMPVRLTDHLKLHTDLNYQFNLGEQSGDMDESEIDWTETTVNIGLSLQLGRFSIRPFINFRSVDGDIVSETDTRVYKIEDNQSSGLILDMYVERTAFVRLKMTSSSNSSMFLSFVREY